MRDGSQMDEITGAVGLGLFSADVVLALGRLIRSSVSTSDKDTLQRARLLLESLVSPVDSPALPSGQRRLAGENALDALAAVESEAAEADVEEFIRPLADALKESLKGSAASHVTEIETLRRVFAAIGDAEVSRVSRLSRPRSPSAPLWQTSTAISGS
jgi:hypothetical protein